jgi:hypothetical protein
MKRSILGTFYPLSSVYLVLTYVLTAPLEILAPSPAKSYVIKNQA